MQAVRRPITLLLAGALVLFLLLAALPPFGPDADLFRAWGEILGRSGPDDFYQSPIFHAYAPGYMYFLWLLGGLDNVFGFSSGQWDYALKLPSIAADLGAAYLLYRLLAGQRQRWRVGAAALYLLFPATLLIGPVWGQNDPVLAFCILLAIYFLAQDRLVPTALVFTAGFLVKPQAIAALPFLVFWIVRDHPPAWKRVGESVRVPVPPLGWLRIAGSSLLLALVVSVPFFPSLLLWRPLVDLLDQVKAATNAVRINSWFAYNIWGLMGKDTADRCDSLVCVNPTKSYVTYVTHGTQFLGLSTRFWGFFLFAVAVAAVIVSLRKARGPAFLALGTSLSIFAFYVFTTRMHERYLFSFFLPFLAACVFLKSRVLWAAFAVLGAVHFLNLYLVYTHAGDNALRYQRLYDWLRSADLWGTGVETGQVLSAIVVAALFVLVPTAWRLAREGAVRGASV